MAQGTITPESGVMVITMILPFSCEHPFLHQKGPEQRLRGQNTTNLPQISMRASFIFDSENSNIFVFLKRDILQIKKKAPARQTGGVLSELFFTKKHHHSGPAVKNCLEVRQLVKNRLASRRAFYNRTVITANS